MSDLRTEQIPAGWDRNPSSWPQRRSVLSLAVIGLLITSYMALYEYGITDTLWEPIFSAPSDRLLEVGVSRQAFVQDAPIGAGLFLFIIVATITGGGDRWRSKPWAVFITAAPTILLSVIFLRTAIAQPLLYGQWSTLCLAVAAISASMIGPMMDEVLAACQQVKALYSSQGTGFWRALRGLETQTDTRSGRIPETAKA